MLLVVYKFFSILPQVICKHDDKLVVGTMNNKQGDTQMSEQIQIAKIIAEQIGTRRMFALGATQRMALNESADKRGGLQFKASLFGNRQCKVIVELTHSDTYNVLILKPRAHVVIAEAKDIHCEELGDFIEATVEQHFASR